MTLLEDTTAAIEECKKLQNKLHCFTYICEKEAVEQAKAIEKLNLPLKGLFVTIKDNICVKDVPSTAGSAILNDHKPIYDATVVARLKEAGAIILGMTVMDEFGFGTWTTNVGVGRTIPKNPHDATRVTGGSSGGAAAITAAASFPHAAIAESTGGSIETPAAFCGVLGYCPTYGRISRHGLISYADSLDKIGVMAKDTKIVEKVLKIVEGQDGKDLTATHISVKKAKSGKLRIGALDIAGVKMDGEVKKAYEDTLAALKKQGHTITTVKLPFTQQYGVSTYYVLAMCEASTNLAAYCGLRYGAQDKMRGRAMQDYFSGIRSKNFGDEAKRRILLGTYMRSEGYRDRYYTHAAKTRTAIITEYNDLFQKVDIIISPTVPCGIPTVKEATSQAVDAVYATDVFTVGPNLAGIPHASFPVGSGKLPIGLLACAGHHDDNTLLSFIGGLE